MESWRTTSSLSPWGVQPRPFALAAHFLGLVSVLFVFIWTIHFRGGLNYNSANTQHIFNVHPALMVLSLVFLASEASLAYRTIPGSKAFKKRMHLLLHFIALILAIVGICAVFKQHNIKGIENLYSLHSWLGLACLVLFGLQWLIGLFTFFYPGLAQSTKSALAPWHVFMGLFAYGLSIASTEMGFVEKLTILQQKGTIAKFSSEAMFVNVLGLIVLLLAICVYVAIIIPMECDSDTDHYKPINPID